MTVVDVVVADVSVGSGQLAEVGHEMMRVMHLKPLLVVSDPRFGVVHPLHCCFIYQSYMYSHYSHLH